MVRGHHQHQVLTDHRPGTQPQLRRRHRGKDQVVAPRQKAVQQLLSDPGAEGEVDLFPWILRQEAGGQVGYEVHPQGAHQPQADQPLPLGAAPQGLHPGVQGGEGALRAHQKLLPQPGESGVAAAALEEGDPQLRLQLADGVAQAGLSDE